MIPEYIIELFKLETGVYPCISEILIPYKKVLYSFINKSETIWFYSDENHEKRIIKEEYLLYDKTGIYIYYTLNENDEYNVFIMSIINKRDVVEFTLHMLKKTINDYGNNV